MGYPYWSILEVECCSNRIFFTSSCKKIYYGDSFGIHILISSCSNYNPFSLEFNTALYSELKITLRG
jgi:hypothetical protein